MDGQTGKRAEVRIGIGERRVGNGIADGRDGSHPSVGVVAQLQDFVDVVAVAVGVCCRAADDRLGRGYVILRNFVNGTVKK